jgi:hypothetical protein
MYYHYKASHYFRNSSDIENAEMYAFDFVTVSHRLMNQGVANADDVVARVCTRLLRDEELVNSVLGKYDIVATDNGKLFTLLPLLKLIQEKKVLYSDLAIIFGYDLSAVLKVIYEGGADVHTYHRAKKIDCWELKTISPDTNPTDPCTKIRPYIKSGDVYASKKDED